MRLLSQWRDDWGVLRQLLRGMPRAGDQQSRLEGFYAKQAADYDRFRQRLLPGRAELIASLTLPAGSRVVELGAGTGANLQFFSEVQRRNCHFTLVDLCRPLLAQARAAYCGIDNVDVIEADASTYEPERKVDLVLMSYSLSMMPEPEAVLRNARRMLRSGGMIAVVDFYLSDPKRPVGRVQHLWWERQFWLRWFAHDGVMLSSERLHLLTHTCLESQLSEGRYGLPYLPLLRVPYFLFRGRV